MKKQMKKSGFTLVEIMIVVAIIGLLAAIGIPSFQKARANSIAKIKINNCRMVDDAVQQYALEAALSATANVTAADIYLFIKGATSGDDLTSTSGPLAVGSSVPTIPTAVNVPCAYAD